MVTTVLEYVGAVTVAAGIACLVLVLIPAWWPVALLVFGVGLFGVSALFSRFLAKGGRS